MNAVMTFEKSAFEKFSYNFFGIMFITYELLFPRAKEVRKLIWALFAYSSTWSWKISNGYLLYDIKFEAFLRHQKVYSIFFSCKYYTCCCSRRLRLCCYSILPTNSTWSFEFKNVIWNYLYWSSVFNQVKTAVTIESRSFDTFVTEQKTLAPSSS